MITPVLKLLEYIVQCSLIKKVHMENLLSFVLFLPLRLRTSFLEYLLYGCFALVFFTESLPMTHRSKNLATVCCCSIRTGCSKTSIGIMLVFNKLLFRHGLVRDICVFVSIAVHLQNYFQKILCICILFPKIPDIGHSSHYISIVLI